MAAKRKKAPARAGKVTKDPMAGSGTSGPVVPRTALAETASRRLLGAALSPWLVTDWDQHDYGIDDVVEIINPVAGSTHHDPSGAHFAVQLKATDATEPPTSLVVTTGHLRYWLRHSMPVLLVSAHLKSGTLRGRWIDQSLVVALKQRTPDFWAQKTVAISLVEGFEVNNREMNSIERHVTRFHARATALTPGKFFELRKRVDALADELLRIGDATGLESVRLLVERTRRKLQTSAYMVAITGPQRVGKSTLINALLRADISPVAAFPTTAVPLVFGAGESAAATVTFADGSTTKVDATVDALRPFAAQQESDASARPVRLVRVTLPNDALARGIEVVDTPGLHDASEPVREVTEVALKNADAVLFVLDAGLDMKFKLSVHEIEDLRRLQSKKEHLIILLNQSDLLSAERRGALLGYVQRELTKYGLADGLPCQPLFVSGREAWQAHVDGAPVPDEFRVVEDEVWGHLLRTRRTGLHRLQDGVVLLQAASEEMATLSADRQTKGREATDIEAARRTCTSAASQARRLAQATFDEDVASFRSVLNERAADACRAWRKHLAAIPTSQDLPTAEAARQRLLKDVASARNALWHEKNEALERLATRFNALVRDALADARVKLGIPPIVSMQDVHLPPLPALDLSLPESFLGLLGGAVFFFLNPIVGTITTAIGFLIGHDVAVAKRRARTMKKLIEGYETRLQEVHEAIERQIEERYASGVRSLFEQAQARLDTFIRDAARRVERLGRPMSKEEEARLSEARAVAMRARRDLQDVAHELAALTYEKAD